MKEKIRINTGTILAIIIIVLSILPVSAQELNCQVEVNASKIENANKDIFVTLQEAMSEYLNTRKWTNTQFSPIEKIDCRLFLTVSNYENDRIKGDLQIQLSRPVYNSTYTTTLFNFKDTKVEFDYRQGDPLIYNENSFESNLTAILNYYAYLLLALDFDSFSELGGQPYFDKASAVVQMAQSSGETGWRTFEDNKNRSGVLAAYTDHAGGAMRKLMYTYHRKGLDEMVTSPDKGRAAITESLTNLKNIYQTNPMSVSLSIFRDSKLDELVNVYSKAGSTEKQDAYNILEPLYPTDRERLDKIRKDEN